MAQKMTIRELPRNQLIYVCKHVFESTCDINLVMCHDDLDLAMTCGGYSHQDGDYHGVGLGHLVDRDESILEIPSLGKMTSAERSNINEEWVVSYDG